MYIIVMMRLRVGRGGRRGWIIEREAETNLARCLASFKSRAVFSSSSSSTSALLFKRSRRTHPTQRRVPVILTIVVRAAGQAFGNLAPGVTQLSVRLDEDLLLFGGPIALSNARV